MAKHMNDLSSTPTQEQIARRAYEIFIERGQPEGQDLAHWLEAEKQLNAAGQAKSVPQMAGAPVRATQPVVQSNGRGDGNGKSPARAAARK